jgi:CheY-like chemotaxis protein
MPPNPRILIVDDDPIIPQVLTLMLQKRGYTVTGVLTSGEEAVLKTPGINPDLVIMDIGLAGSMDGIDAAYYLFRLFHYPILFITGMTDEKRLERAKLSHPYGIIFKPFTEIEIATNVELALCNHLNRPKSADVYPAGDPKKIMDMPDGIIITDRTGRIIFFNANATWYIDLPAEEILMKHWREVVMLINDKTGEQLKDPVAEATSHQNGVIYDTNTALVTTTSKRRKVRVSVRPLVDARGKVFTVLVSVREKVLKPPGMA